MYLINHPYYQSSPKPSVNYLGPRNQPQISTVCSSHIEDSRFYLSKKA